MAPNPTRIFHITAIANLPSISEGGVLLAKRVGEQSGVAYQNIAYQGAQGARARRVVATGPGGTIHDYVPFYFAPRSPMLMAINGGRVEGCPWRQQDIAHFETTAQFIADSGLPFVFYDQNATLEGSECYDSLDELDRVAWDLICEQPRLDGYCKYFFDRPEPIRYFQRMQKRQAEFLVHERLPIEFVHRVGVIDAEVQGQVREVFRQHGVIVPVEVRPDWYFLGQ